MARIFTDAGGQALATASQKITDLDTFSVAFWLKRTATPAAARGIIGMGTATGWNIGLTTGNLINADLIYSGATDKVRNSTTAPALNTWVHVVVTHNQTGLASTDFTFYFDGKSEAGANVSSGVTARINGAAPLTVGSGIGTLLAPPAQIGGPVAIWSRALSPAEALALATGAHPTRFRESLVEVFDMSTATVEEGWISKLFLAQGATNPTSAAVNPAGEYVSRALYTPRVGPRPRLTARARYSVNGASPISFNAAPAIANWLVAASVLAAAVSLPATPATQSWVVPSATLSVARTLAATPATQSWSVPASSLSAGGVTLGATPAVQTWNVPAALLGAARTLSATPAIQTWTTPGGGLSASGGATIFNATPAVASWTVPAQGLAAQRTLAATPSVQTWAVPSVGISAARTLAATPAVQTWVIPSAQISNPGIGIQLNATPAVRSWVVPAALLITDTWTFQFAGGPVLSASVSGGGVLIASITGGPSLSATVSGGPV